MNKSLVLVIFSTILTTAAQLFYKEGANRLPDILTNWPLAAGFLLYCLAAVFIIFALRTLDLSVALPALATSFVWVSIISVFKFHETLHAINWIGIAAIIIGVALLGGG